MCITIFLLSRLVVVKGTSVKDDLILWLLLPVLSVLSFQSVSNHPQCPVHHMPQSAGIPGYLLCDLQFYCLPGPLFMGSGLPSQVAGPSIAPRLFRQSPMQSFH
jgi:hypothetical protein